ncbi:MAG: alpha/beta fold hydrolase [Ignavibacteria bacterium]|mgnify:CR=1 FL=1|nr:alpha/beta fold hydrolase [Ignavibacteria bacterium]
MKPILLLHGALGSKSQFAEISEILSQKYEVFTFDFTGHGANPLPETQFTIETFAQDISVFMRANGLDGTDIFGYSMGGYAALYASAAGLINAGRIFTLATKFEWNVEIAAREAKMLDAGKIKQKVPAFAEELAARHGSSKWESLLGMTREMVKRLGDKNPLNNEMLAKVNNEVLVSIGDRDKMVSLEETIAAYRAIENGSLLVLPKTEHPIERVDIQRLTHEMKTFFGK